MSIHIYRVEPCWQDTMQSQRYKHHVRNMRPKQSKRRKALALTLAVGWRWWCYGKRQGEPCPHVVKRLR